MPGNLVRLCSLPKFELVSCKEDFYNVDHCERRGCYYIDGNASGSDFSNDNFEDCHFTDGHQEDNCLNDSQGVNETPGAYQEASTTSLAKVWSKLEIKASYTHSRTGAKIGFNCTPKV